MRRADARITTLGLACAGLLLAAAPAFGQMRTGGGASSMSSGSGGLSFGGASSFGGGSLGGGSFGSGSSFGGGNFGGSSSFGGGNFGGGNFGGGNFGGGNFGGGNFGGTPGIGTGGRGTSAQYGATSFLGSTYANPLAMGLVSGSGTTTTTTAFGTALYNLNSNTRGGTAALNTASLGATGLGMGYNIRRLPAYATALKIKDLPPPPTAGQVQASLQAMLAQSPQLDPRNSVRVVIDGPVVVLQGKVVDDDERRLVENMVVLSPGVYQVRNELTAAAPVVASGK